MKIEFKAISLQTLNAGMKRGMFALGLVLTPLSANAETALQQLGKAAGSDTAALVQNMRAAKRSHKPYRGLDKMLAKMLMDFKCGDKVRVSKGPTGTVVGLNYQRLAVVVDVPELAENRYFPADAVMHAEGCRHGFCVGAMVQRTKFPGENVEVLGLRGNVVIGRYPDRPYDTDEHSFFFNDLTVELSPPHSYPPYYEVPFGPLGY